MARVTKVVGFSVPPRLAKEVEALALREKTTKSELFRRMVDTYKLHAEERGFYELQQRMARRIRPRAFSEEDVERIVFEDR